MVKLLTKTYLVVGLNRQILIEKLKKRSINLLKIEILDKKRAKITIDAKDTLKYFAICKNSWYNKQLRVGGILAPFYLMVKNWLVTLSVCLFFCVCFFANGIYFESQYVGDAINYRALIESELEKAGIVKYAPFSQSKLNGVKLTLEKEREIAFISVTKRGNKAVIEVKKSQTPPQSPTVSESDLIATEDMVILNVTVYSGTQCVQVGQAVKKGEVIAKASYLVDENEVKTLLYCEVTAECVFEYVYKTNSPINQSTKTNALLVAKTALGDYPVRSYDFVIENKNQIKVIIKYEKTLNGG